MWAKQKASGFTIVELLIVIVVIAILAAITIVAYNGIQARASDSRIQSAAKQIEKAIQLYVNDYGPLPTGLGYYASAPPDCTASAGGWAAKTAYAHNCTLEYELNDKGLLPNNFMINQPRNKALTNSNGINTFMFYRCTPVGQGYYVLFWYLESPSAQDISNFNTVTTQCSLGTGYRTTYGMQGAKLIQT